MNTRFWSFLLIFPLFVACSNGGSTSSKTLFEESTVVSGSPVVNATSASGTGALVFNMPLSGSTSKTSFALAFSLAEGGSLELVANASRLLASGVSIRFARAGGALSARLRANGAETDVTSKFASVDASSNVNFQIDIHNDENPTHVMVWSGSDFSESAALLNSEETGYEAPGKGTSSFWGLKLDNATVLAASLGAPKFVEQ